MGAFQCGEDTNQSSPDSRPDCFGREGGRGRERLHRVVKGTTTDVVTEIETQAIIS